MYVLDQKYRAYLSNLSNNPRLSDSLMSALKIKENLAGALWTYQKRVDSMNLIRTEEIIKTHGYPGSSLVGLPTNEAVFYIIQHSPKIQTYFPLIKQAGQSSQLPFSLSAMMEDRLLTQQAKPQIYGTQAMCYPLKGSNNNKMECFIWPIENPASVNARRRQAGFPTTVEENAKRLEVDYKVLTIDEVKRTYRLGN